MRDGLGAGQRAARERLRGSEHRHNQQLGADMPPRLRSLSKVVGLAALAGSLLVAQAVHAANDWVNFATVSMTNPTTPKLTGGYGCYTDGKDILCDSAASAVSFGTGGLIDYGGMTVVGAVSASAVSATYVSGTAIQVGTGGGLGCTAGVNGAMRYSSTSNTLEICTGTTWTTLASGTITGSGISGGSATAVAFWSGPNSLTYESATTSGLYWDHANGRLGVGTNAPSTELHVSGTGVIRIAGSSARIAFEPFGYATTNLWNIDNSAGNLRFFTEDYDGTNGALKMIITSASTIGIGTAYPGSSLTVVGTVLSKAELVNNRSGLGSPNVANFIAWAPGTAQGQLVGMSFYPTFSNTADNGPRRAADILAGFNGGSWGNQYLSFNVGGVGANDVASTTTERMRITNTGNVGIGTQSPTATLQVSGSFTVSQTGQNTASAASMLVDNRGVSVSSIVHINGSAFSPIGAGGNVILSGTTAVSTSSAGRITFYTGGNQRMMVDSNGNVSIGGTAGANANSKLQITQASQATLGLLIGNASYSTTAFDGLGMQVNDAGTALIRGGWNTAKNLILNDNGGNVGIGTAAPTSKLTISGDSSGGFTNNAIEINDTSASGRLYSIGSRGATGFVLGDETAHVGRLTIAPNGVVTLVGVSTCALASGTGTTSCTSDRRLKDRIHPIEDPLDKLMLIKGVTYHWKRKDISGPEHMGVIAQDVEKAFPQAVSEVSDTTIGTAKTVDYSILVAPIIEVIREFKHRFEDNDARIKTLTKQVEALQAQVKQLEARP
ncbi:tail fiber domain-containing protein [Hyphomicrobium sp. DY-1]|uniref:tail fiber domain-containing protein n=1 Tax=Hyphomicrobium sp. DY-1 TaxID=3075650 RepID=UPI0039C0655C